MLLMLVVVREAERAIAEHAKWPFLLGYRILPEEAGEGVLHIDDSYVLILGRNGKGSGSSMSGGAPTLASMTNSDSGLSALADRDTDTLVYVGSKADCAKLQKLFASLDVAPGQVLVKAIIYEVQTSSKDSSAIDLAVSLLKTKVGVTLNESAKDLSNGYVKFHGLGVDFSTIYSALSSDDRFKLVSSPVVRVVSGGSAKFSVGQEVPILSGVSYDSLGKAVQSVTYKDSGVILNLTASIKGAVSDLQIEQQISQFQNTTTGVNSTPTLIKRSLSTSIQAADDDVLVLGGLNEDRSTKTEAGLSFLPALFRAKSAEDQKTEVLLLLNVKRI